MGRLDPAQAIGVSRMAHRLTWCEWRWVPEILVLRSAPGQTLVDTELPIQVRPGTAGQGHQARGDEGGLAWPIAVRQVLREHCPHQP